MRRQIYDYFFLALLGVILYGALKILFPFAGPLLAALLCAVTFHPIYTAFRRKFPHHSPSFHAAIADILVFIFFVTPFILLVWAIVQESSALIAVVREGSTTVAQWRAGNLVDSVPWLGHARYLLSRMFGIQRAQFQSTLVQYADTFLEYLSWVGALLAKNALSLLFDLMIMLFTLFFLFRDGDHLWRNVQNLLPIRHEHKQELVSRFRDTMTGIARGLFLTSLMQGVAATIGFACVKAEGAVLLGALTAVAGLIPLIGTSIIWVPAAFFFLLKGSLLKGLFLLGWGAIVIVGLIDTLLRPYLVGHKMELPLFMLFFALLGGAEIWGAKGLILGPLLFALVPVMLDIYRQNYLRQTREMEAGQVA